MLGYAMTWHGRIDAERHPEAAGAGGKFTLTVANWYDLPYLMRVINRCVREPSVRSPRYRELSSCECSRIPTDDDTLTLDMFLGPGVDYLLVAGRATLRLDLAGRREIGDAEKFEWTFDPGDFDWNLLDGIQGRPQKRG